MDRANSSQEVKPVVTKPPYPKKTSDTGRPPRRENRSGGSASGEPRPFKSPRPAGAPPARANHRSTGSSATLIYGFHAARAALVAGRRKFIAMHATEAAANKLALDITRAGLQPRIVTTDELTRRLGANAVHQGVLLEAGPIEPIDLSEIVDRSGIVLVLDQITDPHNVGAILRTAAAFGVDALVTTTRHAPDFTGVVAKAASGGLDHVPIAEVTNLARALEELGQMGYFRVGLDSEGPTSFEQIALPRPVALVLGAEDKGLRRLTRENCDALARLDMPGAIKSLNVSNACAVALTLTKLRLGGGLPPL